MIIIFHSGTKEIDGKMYTDGGRVLSVTALGKDMKEARKKAYSIIGHDTDNNEDKHDLNPNT